MKKYTEVLIVRMTPKEIRGLKKRAKKAKVSVSEYIRRLIERERE